jgi:perosamine synthetase
VKQIALARPHLGVEEETAVLEVLRSGWLTQGPRVAQFEADFAGYVGAPHAVAVTSCTTALQLTLVALGIAPGDEVICPSHSFIATANAIVHSGATPVFADIDERTFNINAATVQAVLTPRTRAILVVHQVGLPADLADLMALARARDLLLIEDAACAIGSEYQGVRIGRPHGVAACFSFHPRKILTTGEGGMITTASAELAARLRQLRHHGMSVSDLERHRTQDRYLHERYGQIGYNFRMSDLQAAVGIVQLQRLPALLERRRVLADRYGRALTGVAGIEPPQVPSDRVANFQSYVVRLRGRHRAERDRVLDALLREGISTRPGVMAAHREPAYARASQVVLPVTEQISDQTLILPLHHELEEQDQDLVIRRLIAIAGAES